MPPGNTAPPTPSVADWYDHLDVPPPPKTRGVHHLGHVSPKYVRFAVVASDGRVLIDGIREAPMSEMDLAHLEYVLDWKDPPPPRLTLVRD